MPIVPGQKLLSVFQAPVNMFWILDNAFYISICHKGRKQKGFFISVKSSQGTERQTDGRTDGLQTGCNDHCCLGMGAK